MTQLIADSLSRLSDLTNPRFGPARPGVFLPGENHERHYPTDAK